MGIGVGHMQCKVSAVNVISPPKEEDKPPRPLPKEKKPSKKHKAAGDAETQELLPAELEPEGDHFSGPENNNDDNDNAELGTTVQALFKTQELPPRIQDDKRLTLPEVCNKEKEGKEDEESYGIGYTID
jgi:hypothetical protein